MWRAWLPPVAYAALIFYLSSKPALAPPVDLAHADKVAHFLEYGGLGLCLFRAGWLSWRPRGVRPAWILTLGLGSLIAGLDEWFQGTVGRSRSPWDWTADVIGLAAAAWLAHRLAARGGFRGLGRSRRPPGRVARNPES